MATQKVEGKDVAGLLLMLLCLITGFWSLARVDIRLAFAVYSTLGI